MNLLERIFSAEGFIPRRVCGRWPNDLILTHNIADLAIFAAYVAIPAIILVLWFRFNPAGRIQDPVRRHREMQPFRRLIFMFALFIAGCGATHLMDYLVFQWPAYYLAAAIKVWTAAVSWGTVIMLVPALPKIREMKTAAELEETVTQRTQELEVAKKKLEEAVTELTAQNTAKVEFLAMLAHELRNPLSPIRNAVQILQNPGTPEGVQKRSVAMIDRQVTHIARLLDDLLDISRLNRGKVTLRKQALNVSKIVANVVENCHADAAQQGHKVELEILDDKCIVHGDPHRLQQIFTNLLWNSIKYTDRGGHIKVRQSCGNGWCSISVRDNGMGIPGDVLPYVFELFTQGTRALDRSKGGLGIGLSLVQDLVRLHGGTVAATSEGPGKGSEFTVRLPLHQEEEKDPSKESPGLTHTQTRMSILVVDDNVDSADSMGQILQLQGHDAQIVYDGVTAIKKVKAYRPDVILMDIGLPGLDGYACCKMLRSGGYNGRIVAVTGYGSHEDREKSKDAGFDHHLVKPVNQEELDIILAYYAANRK